MLSTASPFSSYHVLFSFCFDSAFDSIQLLLRFSFCLYLFFIADRHLIWLVFTAEHTSATVDPPKSGPRPETRFLHQPALEGLTNLARTESPQHADWNKSDHTINGGGGTAAWRWRRLP
ncbi:hypothetical protein F511_29142 [Dorcoceras hygrometricum]|uniref:Uncharacterized protein n=1 Tax=Dorcoceras hygrometricum TaxID=472368 RepID=A0A2Z7AE29_9LAMI|nr:hypothetical protein F511_29142 [Dorcoceras hygrometricum]